MNDMNWLAIYPEILLLAMGCVVALVDLWVTDEQRRPTYWLTQLTLVVVGAMHFSYFNAGLTTYAMQGMVVADPMGHLLAGFASLATIVTLVYARPYAGVREMLKGELFILSLFTLLGINVMLSANNFLVIYLGLELMSLSLYALVALRRDHSVATEAAMKYFVLGALASGFLLYGLSMMYGATGSLSIPKVFDVIGHGCRRPHGAPAGRLCLRGDDDRPGVCAALRWRARDAQGRALHPEPVLAAGHLRDAVGEQLPGHLPRPGIDEPVAVCAGGPAP